MWLGQVDDRRQRFSSKQSSTSTEYSTLSFEIKARSQHQYNTSFMRHRKSIDSCRKKNTRLTILLLFVSGSFLTLTLPHVVLNLVQSMKSNGPTSMLSNELVHRSSSSDESHQKTVFFYTVARLFMIINHSINFILYLLLGKRFRRDFNQLFFSCWSYFSSERRRQQRQSNIS